MSDQRWGESASRTAGVCVRTGNTCGSDTWQVGRPCLCQNCQAYLYTTHLERERDRLKAENTRLRNLAEAWAIEGDYADGEELHAVFVNIITRLQQVATKKTREVGRLREALKGDDK